MDERDTEIVMEALFDIRRGVYDIHGLIFLPEEDDEDDDAEEVEEDEP